jgi:ankyrin repeat protein
VCQLEVLRNCLNLPALRQKLKELPETLDETYDRILLGIPENCHHEAHAVLQWLTYSRRPMNIAEVAEAIAVDRNNQIFDMKNRMFDIFSVLDICSSLVTLSEKKTTLEKDQTEETRKLQLAHYSVKEYIISSRIQTSHAKTFAIKETEAHEYMGEACLIYLLHFNRSDSIYTDAWVDYPFLRYAAESWYGHRQAILDVSSKILDLSTAFFDVRRGSQFINWLRLHDPEFPWRKMDLKRIETVAAPLYYASLLGILEVVERLLAAGANVNAANYGGWTALQAASGAGHLKVVERLLAAGADVNAAAAAGYRGRMALQAASEGGHLAIVERLLAAGADVNVADYYGWTALQTASGAGNLKVVERLLAAGADVNAAADDDDSGWMALQAASRGGHLEIVDRLLAAGADVNAAAGGYRGWTALQEASEGGHLEIVERLLAAGADANAADDSWTALQTASRGGHLEVVKRLLAAGADVNAAAADRGGQTALQAASEGGHLEVAERLLAAGAAVNAAADHRG